MSKVRVVKDQKLDSLKVANTLILPTGQSLAPGSIFYNKAENSVNFSNGIDIYPLASISGPGSTVVYRPGSTQNDNGVYGDWTQAVAALSMMSSPKYLYFDDSVEGTNNIVIPTGVWDMTGVTWIRSLAGFVQVSSAAVKLTVTVTSGAVLNGLLGIDGPIQVVYNSSTQSAVTIAAPSQFNYSGFFLKNYSTIVCGGSKGFIDITSGDIVFTMDSMASLGDGANPVVEIATGTTLDLYLATSVIVSNLSVIGAGNLNVVFNTSDVGLDLPVQNNFPTVTGLITVLRTTFFVMRHSALIDPTVTDDITKGYQVGDIWVNTITDKIFICANAGTGGALWNGPL